MTDLASIGYRVDSSGIQIATTRLDGMAQAAERVENGATALQQRLNSLTGVTRETANSAYKSAQAFEAFGDARQSIDRLISSYDSTFAATKRYESALVELNRAFSIGAISASEFDHVSENLKRSIYGLDTAVDKVANSARESAQAFEAFDRAKRSVDALRASYDPIFAASMRYEAQLNELNAALDAGVINQQQYADMAQRLGQSTLTAAGQMNALGNATNASGMQLGNLAAQWNDMGVMIAAGQNPLIMALQQGTQINQVFDQMGGTGADRVRALGAAFASVISPANLLTIGIIAGGAALIQWAMSAMSAGDGAATFEDALDSLEEAISRVSEISQFYGEGAGQAMVDVYGAQNEAIREHIRLLDDVAQRNALAQIGAPVQELLQEVDGWTTSVEGGLRALFAGANLTRAEFQAATADARDLADALRQASEATDVESAITAYTRVRDLIISATGGVENMTSEQRQFFDRVMQSLDAVMRLRNESARPGWFSHAISQARILRDLVLETLESASRIPDSQYQMFLGYQAYYQSRADAPDSPVSRPGLDGGNGGGGADPMIAQIEALRDSLMTERETIDAWYAESQAILADRRAMEILGEQGHREALLDVEVEYQRRLAGIREESGQSQLDQAATLFGELNTLAGGGYDGLLRVQRSFAAASALINAYTAASQALADPSVPFFAKFAAVAKVLASGFGLVNAIKGGNKASGPSSASGMASTAPDQRVLIDVQGPDWAKDMIEGVLNQLYTQTKNGARPVFVS